MLKLKIVTLLLILFSASAFAQQDSSSALTVVPPDSIAPTQTDPEHPTATLKIWIKTFRSLKGSVFVGLYNKPQGFATENAFRSFSFEITGAEIWANFDSLTKGNYAVAIIHDENNNHKLDQGEMGIPIEGYGFSNDARGLFGPPDYRLAMFYFSGSANKTITINLLYPKKIK